MKYVQYWPLEGSRCTETIENFFKNFNDMFVDVDYFGEWKFKIVEMTKKEYGELPEFEGF